LIQCANHLFSNRHSGQSVVGVQGGLSNVCASIKP
jgi:hypothetical protein